jgi:glycosyltransferase involved in cell wall biosynthesis
LPSHQENFGIAVVEAMALAIPVLMTQKVNIWREVQASGAGHVVADVGDEIGAGLKYMCSLSRSELQAMGERARNCYLERFNLENNAVELLNLMMNLSKTQTRAF